MSSVGNRLHKIVVGTLIVGTVYAGVNLSYNLAFGWDRFHESQAKALEEAKARNAAQAALADNPPAPGAPQQANAGE